LNEEEENQPKNKEKSEDLLHKLFEEMEPKSALNDKLQLFSKHIEVLFMIVKKMIEILSDL
jgi:hypothetical protein